MRKRLCSEELSLGQGSLGSTCWVVAGCELALCRYVGICSYVCSYMCRYVGICSYVCSYVCRYVGVCSYVCRYL